MPYPSPLLGRVRALPGGRWDPGLRVWRVPDSAATRQAVRNLLGAEAAGRAREAPEALAPIPEAPGRAHTAHPA
ncbi:MAG: hypothetical protein Q8P50_00950, partial [Bacillota bacterium]|nr:hypothetical protein [Bacillota bacterium]